MTAEQFTYWLQGFSEINGSTPSEAQWQVIQDHLAEVFDKKTPDRPKSGRVPFESEPVEGAEAFRLVPRHKPETSRRSGPITERLIC